MWPVQIFFSNLSFILIALVGGMLVISGQFEVGYIQTFITYSRQINQPIMTIGSIASVMQTAAASSERIFELLDAPEEEKNFIQQSMIKLRVMLVSKCSFFICRWY